jgi:anti-anti-sigma factor
MTTLHETPAHSDRSAARTAVVTASFDEQGAAIRAVGDLDAAASSRLRRLIDFHVSAGRRFLRVDLSGVTGIGESALRLLEATHQRLLAQRGTLVLIGSGEGVTRVLRSADLADELFLLEPFASDPLAY